MEREVMFTGVGGQGVQIASKTLATAAIDDQSWLRQNRARILATRQRLVVALGALGFETVPSEEWQDGPLHRTLDVDIKGTYHCMRHAIARMRPRRAGSIVNLGSVAALVGTVRRRTGCRLRRLRPLPLPRRGRRNRNRRLRSRWGSRP